MPPKLEDRVSPQELLDAMRSGVLKSALAKKYRASDEDFALMLYPMYRRGELTKQEFNDFFNLIPITSGQEAPFADSSDQVATIRQEPADPADIVRTITANLDLPPELAEGAIAEVPEDDVTLDEEATFEEIPDLPAAKQSKPGISDEEALKVLNQESLPPAAVQKVQKTPEPPPAEPAPKKPLSLVRPGPERAPRPPTEEPSSQPQDVGTSKGDMRRQHAAAAVSPPTPERPREPLPVPKPEKPTTPETPKLTPHPVPKPVPQRQPEQKAIQPEKDIRAVKPPDYPAHTPRPVDVGKLKSILETIVARLNSIDERLAKIEKKLPE
ncbi:MAG: hypothetical protein AB1646_14850 [Thermodesulfobacteriota bacterium]